ncbi:MAG: hypothetical protein A3D31_07605 [Candidatus Fluviicola riflensis]|nr:MAG: hypothetical protein A3D31_07605 [Candidatus Fluviicola riflensis]OGS82324.1 MAG: hypothetical protein A2724_16550 [Fluviicola sp. RIFCSPHIGHO2_01_FULL_43_53]OGS87988.1 MAG: hypothetical protein A3E30_13985 [Fluviicola sp. RIFCSPHIGHO2_12_FULL_43_24]
MKQSSIYTVLLLIAALLPLSAFSQTNTLIGEPATNEYGLSICVDDFGNTIVGGTRGNAALVIKQDAQNNTIWSKTLSFTTNSQYTSEIGFIDVLADTIFGCGWVSTGSNIGGAVYFKLNAQTGVPYWIKTATSSVSCFSTMRYSNGIYMLVAAVNVNGIDRDGKVIGVSSLTGQIIWETPTLSLRFPPYNADHLDDFTGATEIVNGQIFITGRSYVNGASSYSMRALLIGVDITGNVFLKRYLLNDVLNGGVHRFYGMRIEFDGADSLVVAYSGDDNCSGCTDYRSGILKCDLLGNVKFAKYYDIQGVTIEVVRSFNRTPTGYVIYGVVNNGLANMRLFALKTDKQGNYVSCKLIAPPTGVYTVYCGVGNFAAGHNEYRNGIHYFLATTYTSNANLRDIKKIILDDNLDNFADCSLNTNVAVTTTALTPFSGQLISVDAAVPFTFTNSVASNNVVITNQCATATISLSNNTSCTSATITAQLSGVSNATYTWSNGSSGNNITVNSNDTVFVTAVNPANCCIYYDTIVPAIPVSQTFTLELPADTAICFSPGQTWDLNAQLGNLSTPLDYSWNNDPMTTNANSIPPFVVSVGGTYWITATDGCNTLTDSITIDGNVAPAVVSTTSIQVCADDYPYLLSPTLTNYTSVSWSDGTTQNTLNVSQEGIYTITATNDCGSATVDIEVTTLPNPTVQLPTSIDTCISVGGTVLLTAISSDVTDFQWSNSAASQSTDISSSGTYWVNASNSCALVSDTVQVTLNYLPDVTNPTNYTVCEDDYPLTVNPVVTNATSVVWDDGTVGGQRTINQSGNYTIYAGNDCGIDSLVIQVSTSLLPIVTTPSLIDTCIINGNNIPILAQITNAQTTEWSTGNATDQIQVTNSGVYWVAVTNQCGTDSAFSTVTINHFPELYLPAVLDTCFEIGVGFSYTAQGSAGNYAWSSGSSTATEWIAQEGSYTCILTNQCGSITQSMEVNRMSAIDLYIPQDSLLLCYESINQATLGIETNYDYEIWDENGHLIDGFIDETGWYTIHAYNICGTLDDSIYIDLQNEQYFYLPNAFTPGEDEFNSVFIDKGYNYVVDQVEIYNRWGQRVYQESGTFSGWDGTYKGVLCQDGIYQVKIVYLNCAGKETVFYGHVVLLK